MKSSDVARILAPPPLLFLGSLGAGYLAHRFAPPATLSFLGSARVPIGGALLALSLLLVVWGVWVLRAHGTSPQPHKPTLHIVQQGPFRFTRNPLYLSLLLLLAGIGVVMDSAWVCLAVPLLLCLLHIGVVHREEEYLTARFGGDYREYCRRVRRWL